MNVLLGKEARNLTHAVLNTLERNHARDSNALKEQLYDVVEQTLILIYRQGWDDREKETDFRVLKEQVRQDQRYSDRKEWERQQLHGDIDI